MQKDPFDIKVKGKSTQDQIASYLVKVVLGLRDKENTQKSVKLLGSGSAIPHAILVAEIIRSRIKGVNSITQFESMPKENKEQNDKYQDNQFYIPAIRITLTMTPTEEEKLMPGFQLENEVGEDKHIELFDYVMMYIRNLYFSKGNFQDQKRDNKNNRENQRKEEDGRKNKETKSNYNDNPDRRQDNKYKQQQQRDYQANPDKSGNWNNDRDQFQQKSNYQSLKTRGNVKSQGNDRDVQSSRHYNYNENRGEQTRDTPKPPSTIRQGEIRSRGGQQRAQH
ncbi:unnamed protein product [Paramecium octaurelia]|uniref:DNA/RNA-binding protein Alba-like domain-containing protein n=1 Tax=Paramecium octaurelia TaxID=43137 RepID=A0A8S1TX92_PAROT|nr:unnamed protein product [Paramecium octaurelia]